MEAVTFQKLTVFHQIFQNMEKTGKSYRNEESNSVFSEINLCRADL